MLRTQVTPKRALYVSLTDDTHPNKGGFYCQVYEDEMGEFECDNFVIHNYEIPRIITDANERRRKAMVIANARVKQLFR